MKRQHTFKAVYENDAVRACLYDREGDPFGVYLEFLDDGEVRSAGHFRGETIRDFVKLERPEAEALGLALALAELAVAGLGLSAVQALYAAVLDQGVLCDTALNLVPFPALNPTSVASVPCGAEFDEVPTDDGPTPSSAGCEVFAP